MSAKSGRVMAGKEKKEDECVIPWEKGAREKGLRRCLLPHCPRLTASNKNDPPLANVTSYYPVLRYPPFFFVAFSIPCSSFALLLFLLLLLLLVVVVVVTETLVYKTPTRTYSARICMQSISLGNRVTSAHTHREEESAKAFREENPRDRPVLKIRQNER